LRTCGFRGLRWSKEASDRSVKRLLHGGEQPLLADLRRIAYLPVIKAHDHDRDIGQVDDRADAEGHQDLARTQFPDLGSVVDGTHGWPSPFAAVLPVSSSSLGSSRRISLTVGSTSRSEFKQVNSSHRFNPGWWSRFVVTPSRASLYPRTRPPSVRWASACQQS